MSISQKLFLVIFNLCIVVGCASLSVNPKLVKEVIIEGPEGFGGISGIDYDTERDLFYAVSDDRSNLQPARYYTFRLDDSKQITDIRATTLNNPKSTPFAKGTIDPEALKITPDGQLIWSSEVALDGEHVFVTDPKTGKTRSFTIPGYASPSKKTDLKGQQRNKGFEGLSFTRDNQHIIFAVEAPLKQDVAGGKHYARLLVFNWQTQALVKEYFYPIKPYIHKAKEAPFIQDNGITDILMISDSKMLVLERAGWHQGGRKFAFDNRVFSVELEQLPLASAGDGEPELIEKSLLFSLSDFPQIKQDNYEGMVLREHQGQHQLLIISDNNFSPNQRNSLLIFNL